MTYTIKEAKESISTVDYDPSVVVLQVLSNDMKNDEMSEDTIEIMTNDLVASISSKWPNTKIVISLPPPRMDNERVAIKSEVVSAKLKACFFRHETHNLV